MIRNFKILIVLFTVSFLIQNCGKSEDEFKLQSLAGTTMGTTYSIKIVTGSNTNIDLDNLQPGIDSLLKRLNMQMSTYIEESEISRFNNYDKTDWFDISKDFADVLEMAMYINEKSNGAFDITVGPLVNLWGFGPGYSDDEIPSQKEIEKKLKFIGSQYLQVRSDPPAVRKAFPEIYCDLSAIAKGFGVDKTSDYLEHENIENYMVEIGGEVRTRGHNKNSGDWRIGISTPDEQFALQKVIPLQTVAMATSGDYRNYFEKDGVRYSHTIDPRTGKPITHNLASVTVIHGSCMIADGMATAIDVLGPNQGFDLAVKEDLPVYMIIREKDKYIEKMTPQFEEMLKEKKEKENK